MRARMGDAPGQAKTVPPKRAHKVVNGRQHTYNGEGGMRALLFHLPAQLCNYILRLAISPTPGVMTMRKALVEYQISWRTIASLRLVHKRSREPGDVLNAIFYEATLRLWMQTERVAFANDQRLAQGEVRRIQERDRDTFCAISRACGRDQAAWKRALAAYKATKDRPHEAHLLTP